MMVVKDIKRKSEELIRRAHAAELASGSGVGVRQVAAGSGDVSVHVPRAGHARRRRNRDEFNSRAVHLLFADSLSEQTLNEIGVGRQSVHPLPPSELPVGCRTPLLQRLRNQCVFASNCRRPAYKVITKEKSRENSTAAISALGAIAANSLSNEVQRAIRSSQENIKRTKPNVV